jgi:hypothetical protein
MYSGYGNLPSSLYVPLDEARMAMEEHPGHHLAPYYRTRIYQVLMRDRNPFIKAKNGGARGWLAVLSAEKVLPVFEHGSFRVEDIPKGKLELPSQLLDLSKRVMHNDISPSQALQEAAALDAHQEFNMMLNESNYDPEGFPVNAIMAGLAAATALGEACGLDDLSLLQGDERRRWLSEPIRGKTSQVERDSAQAFSQDDPIDETFVLKVNPDAAAYAAVAYSCGINSTKCDPQRLRGFWTWWLTEALPKAWKLTTEKSASG